MPDKCTQCSKPLGRPEETHEIYGETVCQECFDHLVEEFERHGE